MHTVLIVEDDAATRRLLKHLMERELRCDVLEAGTAADGKQLLAARRPDLVLLDLGLPDEPGEAVLAAARSEGMGVPVVVVSAENDRDRIEKLAGPGLLGYLLKPIHLPTAIQRLQQVLGSLPYRPPPAG